MGGQHPRSHIVAPANAGKKSNGQGHVEDEFCSCWCKGTPSPMPISQVKSSKSMYVYLCDNKSDGKDILHLWRIVWLNSMCKMLTYKAFHMKIIH